MTSLLQQAMYPTYVLRIQFLYIYTILSYSFLHNMNIKVKNDGSHIVQRPGFWGCLRVAQAEISTYVHCLALSSNKSN